jgi:DNA-binding transcriptional ArsR family regulator
MDLRTTQILAALDSPSADLLVELAHESLSEKELLERLPGLKQPSAHKKLARLEEVGLIRQARRGRKVPWELVAPEPTVQLLRSLLRLSDALDTKDRQLRSALQTRFGVGPGELIVLEGGQGNSKAGG